MDRSTKINILSFIIVAGFALAVGYHYYYSVYQNRPYPYNTFLFIPKNAFSDYRQTIKDSHTLNPYLQYKSAQYPFLIILGYLFSLIHIQVSSYFFYIGLIWSFFLLFNILNLRGQHWYTNATSIFIITFLTYPFLFVVDRGNFESLLFIFLLAFLLFYARKQYLISAIFLAFAISMKLYPAILLILFIPDRKYRELVVCLAATAAITLISLLCFSGGLLPNLNFLLLGSNINSNQNFTRFISIDSNWVQRGVTLLTLFKIFYFEAKLSLPGFITSHFMLIYMILASTIGLLVVLYVIFIEKEIWKRVALLVFAMLLLPPISADYKLLHIFVPLYLFITIKNPSKFDLTYLLLFALMLIPKDFYYFPAVISDDLAHDISISVVINILAMIAISALIITSGIKNWITNLHKSIPAVSNAS